MATMMKCLNCQAPVSRGDSFCSACGTRIDAPVGMTGVRVGPLVYPSDRPVAVAADKSLCLEGHAGDVLKVAFLPDGRHAISASRAGDIHVWDLQAGRSIKHRPGSLAGMSAVDFAKDGKRAVCHTDELCLIDLESGKTIAKHSKAGWMEALALLPGNRMAVYGHLDHSLRLLDLETGKEQATLKGHTAQAECIACSPNGRFGISGRIDAGNGGDTVLFWDISSGAAPRRPKKPISMPACFAFVSNDRHVLAGTYDGAICFLNFESGGETRRYEGHAGNVLCVATSPAGNYFVSGSGTDSYDADLIRDLGIDNTVRAWADDSSRELARFEGHQKNVTSVAVSPDGKRILSGSADRTVRLWTMPEIGRR